MSNPWFRMYVDFLTDSKMISIAFEDQRHFIGILALKSSGILDQQSSDAMMNRIVSQRLWIDHSLILDVKKRLIDAGLIDDKWQPLAWEKRQRKSDLDNTAAERQRRYRESLKVQSLQEVNPSNALCNGSVTRLDKNRIEENREDKTKGTRINPNLELNIEFKEAALGVRAIDPDELQRVFDEFKDYWIAVPGSKGVKLDWLATWRNWVRRTKTTAAVTVKKNNYFDN